MTRESIDYGGYDIYHGGLDDIYEKIVDFCNKKYGYGNWDLQDYDVDITINAEIIVDGEQNE